MERHSAGAKVVGEVALSAIEQKGAGTATIGQDLPDS